MLDLVSASKQAEQVEEEIDKVKIELQSQGNGPTFLNLTACFLKDIADTLVVIGNQTCEDYH